MCLAFNNNQQLLIPFLILFSDSFAVEILENQHTVRLGLKGSYRLAVNSDVVAIHSEAQNSYEWSLNMLKRFHLEKNAEQSTTELLVIECGP